MKFLILIITTLVVLAGLYSFAEVGDYDTGYIASIKFQKCYKVREHPTLGDMRPSILFLKYSCYVNKEDPGGRILEIGCDGYPSPGIHGFVYTKTYSVCMDFLRLAKDDPNYQP